MAAIRVLDKHTANRIAAGEVVERPASVVKELVENSLDAGARHISIETAGGGLERIRVTDDGCGIPSDEAETAFLRHATSKIVGSDDLAHIETLGFRGEALASIAAVARVELRTRTDGSEAGRYVAITAGDVKETGLAGMVSGTTMEVDDLFYNVPARLKFVKSPRAESAYISDYVARLIMARPDVAFEYIQSGKTVYRSGGANDLKEAIYCVYGPDVLPYIVPLALEDGEYRVSGFIGTERIGRANRTAQSFFVNGRYIKSQKLSFALQRAYDTRLMVGRFPFAVVNIFLDPSDVDVNVHPNKLDVRFREEDRVVRAIHHAARAALSAASDPSPVIEPWDTGESARTDATRASGEITAARIEMIEADRQTSQSVAPGNTSGIRLEALPRSMFGQQADERSLVLRDAAGESPILAPEIPKPFPTELNAEPVQTAISMDGARIAGCIFDCYWLVERGEAVYMIDQHAAHERQLYEKIMRDGVNADSQLLLVPVVKKLSPLEFDTVISNLKSFEELGFDISEFGPFTISIRAVPSIMGKPETESFLMEAIDALDKRKRLNTSELKRTALIRYACRHAIKAGDKPSETEIAALLSAYESEGIPMTCPHGRPVMVKLTRQELEKLFKRII